MKTTIRKTLAIFLTLSIVISLIPAPAYAYVGAMTKGTGGVTASQQDGYYILKNDYIGLYIRPDGNLTTVPSQKTLNDVKWMGATETHFFYKDSLGETITTDRSKELFPYYGPVTIDSSDPANPKLVQTFMVQEFSRPVRITYQLVQLDKGASAGTTKGLIVEKVDPDNGRTWGVLAEATIVGYQSPEAKVRWGTKHLNFAGVGHTLLGTVRLARSTARAEYQNPEAWWDKYWRWDHYAASISSGLARVSSNNITEAFTDSFSYANQFVAMNGYCDATFGSLNPELITGIRGHWGNYADQVSYESGNGSKLTVEHKFSGDAKTSALWGFRDLYATADSSNIPADPVSISRDATCVGIISQNGTLSAKAAANEAALKAQYGNNVIAIFRGSFNQNSGNYVFTNGAAQLSPSLTATWTEGSGVFSVAANGTVTARGVNLSTPSFKFYKPKNSNDTSLNFSVVNGKLKIGITPDNNDAILHIDIPGSSCRVSGVTADLAGTVIFGGMLSISTPALNVANIEMTRLGMGWNNNLFKLQGVEAAGEFDMSELLGLEVAGAKAAINSFPGEERYAFELEIGVFELFEAKGELELKRIGNGALIPNTLKLRAASETGIPLVPPVVVAELNGLGGGFSNLADTINKDFYAIPPIKLEVTAKGTVLETIEGWYAIEVGPGYYKASLTEGTLLKMEIIDEFSWYTELAGDIRNYQGTEYKGLKVGGGMQLDLVIPNEDMPFIKAGSAINASAFAGLDNYSAPTKAYVVLSADGKIYGLVQIPADYNLFKKDIVLASAQLDLAMGGQTAFSVANITPNDAIKQAFGKISGYGGVAYTGKFIGFPYRIYYIFQDKAVNFENGAWLGELDPFNPGPYGVTKQALVDPQTGMQCGLMVMNDNLRLIGSTQNAGFPLLAAVTSNAASENGVSITQSGGSENSYQIEISNSAPDPGYLAFSLKPKSNTEGFLSSLTVQKSGEGAPLDLIPATFNAGGEITNEATANAVEGEGGITIKLPSKGTWTISSSSADFDISCYYGKPYAELSSMSLSGSTVEGTVESMGSGAEYILRSYLAKAEGGTDYLLSETPVTSSGAIAETLSLTGSMVPTGSYYLSTVLLEKIKDDFNGDGTEESTYLTTDTHSFSTTVDYTNTAQPNPPTEVILEDIGSELMRVRWKAPVGNPMEGYYIRLYQKAGSDWMETGANYMLKTANLTADADGFYTYDMAVTVGDKAGHLTANNTFKTGITAFRYLEADSLPVESEEAQSGEKFLAEATYPVLTYSPVPTAEANGMKLLGIKGQTAVEIASDVPVEMVVTRMDTQAVLAQTSGSALTLNFNTPTDFAGALNLKVQATDSDGDITVDYLGLRLDQTTPLITIDSDSFKADYATGNFAARGVTESRARVQVKNIITVAGTAGAELDAMAVTAGENGIFAITGKLNPANPQSGASAADSVALVLNAKDQAGNESSTLFTQIVRGSNTPSSGSGSGSGQGAANTIKISNAGGATDKDLENAVLAAGKDGIVKIETTGDLLSVSAKGLQYLIDQKCSLQLKTETGTMLVTPEVLSGLKIKAGSKVEFKLAGSDGEKNPALGTFTGGEKPIYEVSIYVDGVPIHRLGGTITVTLDGKALPASGNARLIHALHNGAYEDVLYARSGDALLFKLDRLSYVFFMEKAKADGLFRNPFADVAEKDWFYNNVLYAHQTGLMVGTDSDSFSPKIPVTRAMAITVLHRLNGDTQAYSANFADVPKASWYSGAAAWAASKGISAGMGANRFAPNLKITREQLAVLLYNYAKQQGCDVTAYKELDLKLYQDAGKISDYACTALQWACGAGILKGDTSGNLKPQGTANRAEVTAMLQRFTENVIE